jgi:hypothetical protein
MAVSPRSKTLTASLTLKVTSDEEVEVARLAAQSGLSRSEWLRRTITQGLRGEPETRLVLGEMLAFRIGTVSILAHMCEVLAHTCAGKVPARETIEALSRDRIKTLLGEAEARGVSLADSKIKAAKGGTR